MKNFYLTVYAYDLYRNSSEGINEPNALSLWDSLVNLGNTSLPFEGLKDLKSNLLSHDKQNKKVTRLLTKNQEIEEQRERDRKMEKIQRKRDRKLENTIQSVGFATAVGSTAGGILASTYQVSPYFAKNILSITNEDKDASFIQNGSILVFSFFTSIIAGIAFGLAARFVAKLFVDRSDRKELKQEQKLPEHKL